MAAIFLGESIHTRQVIGGVLIIFGMYVTIKFGEEPTTLSEEEERTERSDIKYIRNNVEGENQRRMQYGEYEEEYEDEYDDEEGPLLQVAGERGATLRRDGSVN